MEKLVVKAYLDRCCTNREATAMCYNSRGHSGIQGFLLPPCCATQRMRGWKTSHRACAEDL